MSSQPCSMALEVEESTFDLAVDVPLTLLVNERYASQIMPLTADLGSSDLIELGGTITVSF